MPRRSRPETPTRASRSAAVRWALLNPSARELSRRQRQQLQRRLVYGGALALAALVLGVLAFGFWREFVARGSEPALVVHGTTMTLDELAPWVKPRIQGIKEGADFYRAQGMDSTAVQYEMQYYTIPDRVVSERVDALLIQQEAQRRGITVGDDEVEARLRQHIAEWAAANAPVPTATPTPTGGAATPVAATASAAEAAGVSSAGATVAPGGGAGPTPGTSAAGTAAPAETPTPVGTPTPAATPTPVPTLSPDSFRVQYEAFLRTTAFTNEQYRELVREELLQEKLRESISASVAPVQEQIHARQIRLPERDKAQEVLDLLGQGRSFEELAKERSTDPATKEKGGDLGWLPRGIMGTEWDNAAFALQPGQRSGLVELPSQGFVIIEVLERDPQRPLSEDHLQQLRDEAFIKWRADARSDPAVQMPPLTDAQKRYVLRQAGVSKLP